MCGDSHLPSAPESADLIAIIHPNQQSTFRGRLRLSNRASAGTVSSLQCESDFVDVRRQGLLNVRIHKYGQPLLVYQGSDEALDNFDNDDDDYSRSNPVLHSFSINPLAATTTSTVRLNLGVGGDGVVGRLVSILDGESRQMLGQGVIGRS